MLLATSWTWCIGMFLPVLLLRDFGLWGWVAFALPNIIGAALVGRWNYQKTQTDLGQGTKGTQAANGAQDTSRSLLDQHRSAMMWFSAVTIAFHVFFVSWMVQRLIGSWAVPAFVLAVLLFTVFIRMGKAGWGGWLALILSAMTACSYFAQLGMGDPPVVRIEASQATSLLLLWPAIIIGFVLCPHMDLTLQRIKANLSPAQAGPTFAAGFFGVFLLLITFTLFYASSLQITLRQGNDLILPAAVAGAIGLHMCVQGGITTALHAFELIYKAKPRHLTRSMIFFVVAMIALLILGRSIVPGTSLLGYDPGEVVYRMFIGFYGLIFPAYAWAAWVWRGQSRLSVAAWLGPVLIAMPMFAAGFVAHRPIWIVPGVAVVLILPYLLKPAIKPTDKPQQGIA